MIGAGPAALYSAAKLTEAGHHVVIINRDIKPGGLAEFGIYPNKYKMKRGLRVFFKQILSDPKVTYLGNVRVGVEGDVTLEELRQLGFDAVVVAVGAQGTKWLGLEGEQAEGVFHAKDLVYHYNRLPPYSEREFPIGQNVCVVGLGNVCLDIVHWLASERQVESVTAVARRGPAERKTTRKEMRLVSGTMDLEQLRAEFDAIAPIMQAVGQDPKKEFDDLIRFVDTPLEFESPTQFRMRFFRSPHRVALDAEGKVIGLVSRKTRLVQTAEGQMGLETLDEEETLPCDTIVFAIGDSIEPSLGLPLDPARRSNFATVTEPWAAHPERPRYMVARPDVGEPMWGTFVVGWAREASDGLVGKAKADGEQGCEEILAYLDGAFEHKPEKSRQTSEIIDDFRALLAGRDVGVVDYAGVRRIEAVEQEKAAEYGVEEFKFSTQRAMLEMLEQT